MAGGSCGGGSRVKVVGQVERVDGATLSYAEFVDRFMRPNLPVVLTGLTSSWRSCHDWTLAAAADRRAPDLDFLARSFPSPLVQVADCSSREFSDQKRFEMSMREFVDHWAASSSNGDSDGSLLYLKDWHFVKEYPGYVAYTTPTFFADDWLNMYLDSHPIHRDSDIANHTNEINCADYRFVYMGPKGTWTPLHADVFRSYSWSANVCGRKLWLFLPPSQSHFVFDRNLRSSVYNINDDVSEKQFPEFNNTKWLECTQEQNEIIFVPSGWYHQVHNLEDTISINHNWFNGYNLHWVWNLLHEDYKVAKDYIEDIRDICDDFEGLCQRNLAANTGMNFYDFFVFITRFALANIVELYHIQNPKDTDFISAETANHFVYNLMSIRDVASKMVSTEAFNTENICNISEQNRSAFSDIIKILEEESFRRLLVALSKAYNYIDRGQKDCLKMKDSSQKGCLSVTCLKPDCNVVGDIISFMREIHGPMDLLSFTIFKIQKALGSIETANHFVYNLMSIRNVP
uniref:JmjC domain-containing protein n=1 Tax=Oryza nivara TaxID=4536 RepID=A0A0E0FMX5_ORYNI